MSSESSRTLLRGGAVVSVDPVLGDFRGDVLIDGDVIATIEGARALGKADVTGSITVGKKADIVTLTTADISVFPVIDPVSAIVYGGSRRAVSNVFVNGRRLKASGELAGADIPALHEAADRAARSLIERSGIGSSWRPAFG
jgi:5-methylthioadenosine/S-adenosylhomocysteine deaminase